MVLRVLKKKKLRSVELLLISGITGKTKISTLSKKFGKGNIRSQDLKLGTLIWGRDL